MFVCTSHRSFFTDLLGSLALVLCVVISPDARAIQGNPDELSEDGARFVLVGATTFRWMSVIKVYDARLHLGAGEPSSKVFADIPVRLQLTYHPRLHRRRDHQRRRHPPRPQRQGGRVGLLT